MDFHQKRRKKVFKPFRKNAQLRFKLEKYIEDLETSDRPHALSKRKQRNRAKRNNSNGSTSNHAHNRNIDAHIPDFNRSDSDDFFIDDTPSQNVINTSLREMYANSNDMSTERFISGDHTAEKEDCYEAQATTSKALNTDDKKISNLKIAKKPKPKNLSISISKSSVKFSDVAGMEEVLLELLKLIVHLKKPEIHQHMGINPPRGLLLHGPSGCGKTLIANAIAGQLDLPFISIAGTELISGISGESERNIRDLFETASTNAPCILFIDEIDAIAPKRESVQKDMERRIVAQILKCMDDLNTNGAYQVMVIGATNRPDSLDPALRRAGRFDREISIGIPDEASRLEILKKNCQNIKLSHDFDMHYLVKSTPGYVGADLMSLTGQAAMNAYNEIFGKLINENYQMKKNEFGLQQENTDYIKNPDLKLQTKNALKAALLWLDSPPLTAENLNNMVISMENFKSALDVYVPSAKREGFATIPNVTWSDIGALKDVRKVLQRAILWPIKYKKEFEEFHITSPSGLLLCGPKGCGKTLLAKAIANECAINFISVKGPELLNLYVGESERAVRQLFQRARNSFPCVIFLDEIDALCPPRSLANENAAMERVVNQLLTEVDGAEAGKPVFVLGATNRPEKIDSAMLRPGRLEKVLFIDLPSPEDRLDILKTITKNGTKPKLGKDVDLEILAFDSRCDSFTGADLKSLVGEASLQALEDHINQQSNISEACICELNWTHFERAFQSVKPSVSKSDQDYFKKMKCQMFSQLT